jgi:hypothetical protein
LEAKIVDNPPVKRWRFQFTLRTMLLVTTLCAVVISVVATFPGFFAEDGPIFFFLWLVMYLPASIVLCAPLLWFGRNRVATWCKWDYLILVLPYLVWATLTCLDCSGKSLSNLVEPLWLALTSGLAPLGRVILGKVIPPRRAAVGALLLICAVAAALWAFVPGLPE